jgi:hypothetical protein
MLYSIGYSTLSDKKKVCTSNALVRKESTEKTQVLRRISGSHFPHCSKDRKPTEKVQIAMSFLVVYGFEYTMSIV